MWNNSSIGEASESVCVRKIVVVWICMMYEVYDNT